MKKYYVYELINSLGTVEYVGCTYRPKYRFNQHTKRKPSLGHGKFYGRQDLTMHIVKEFHIRKEAFLFEGELKLSHGMEWTEKGKTNIPITAWDYLTGDFIGQWDSMKETAIALTKLKGHKIVDGNISQIINGKRNHTAGMTFKRI